MGHRQLNRGGGGAGGMGDRCPGKDKGFREDRLVQSGVMGAFDSLGPPFLGLLLLTPVYPWPPEGLGGPLQAVHGEDMVWLRVPPDPPALGTCGVSLPAPRLPFVLIQCKLEQQACLSNKQLTVRCEGLCPCPTEQATTSTDGKPGNEECRPQPGWGSSLPGPPGVPLSGLWADKRFTEQERRNGRKGQAWGTCGSGDPVNIEQEGLGPLSRREPAPCSVCLGSEGEEERG